MLKAKLIIKLRNQMLKEIDNCVWLHSGYSNFMGIKGKEWYKEQIRLRTLQNLREL